MKSSKLKMHKNPHRTVMVVRVGGGVSEALFRCSEEHCEPCVIFMIRPIEAALSVSSGPDAGNSFSGRGAIKRLCCCHGDAQRGDRLTDCVLFCTKEDDSVSKTSCVREKNKKF